MSTSKEQYYLVHVFGCVDPQAPEGPFATYDALLERATEFFNDEMDQESDVLFYLYLKDGCPPSLESFPASAFADEDLDSYDPDNNDFEVKDYNGNR